VEVYASSKERFITTKNISRLQPILKKEGGKQKNKNH